ncbi:MAG TPA: hypothetical protein VHE30_05345 [Polyangiaceae bacterium]|nr:hypothetical protein [Polyangiaceae bacterium]
MSELRFPILVISESTVLSFDTRERWRSMLAGVTERALRSGFFENATIVQQDGTTLRVAAVVARERHWLKRALGGTRGVESLELVPAPERNVDELKKDVLSAIEANPDVWGAAFDVGKLNAEVADAPSLAALVRIFS